MTLDAYLAKRRYWELTIALGVLLISLLANIGTVWIDLARVDSPTAMQTALVLETTSHIGMAIAAPFVLWFDKRVPIAAATWRTSLLGHAGFSVVFSFVHVVTMYWGRILTYDYFNSSYHWDNWPLQFFYEYLKDFRTYLLIIALVYLYRFIIRRLQGEAGFVSEGKDDSDQEPVHDRFLIKKLGREFLVRLHDIDWIESSGNYVNLHVGPKVYPLRETMTNISNRLTTHGFQRVHRSAIVNLDRVAEIVAFDTGDGEARLVSEATVPVSRRFRKELRERLG
ncbi:MAG: LytTR family DNA-binding domain-containing protein [Woeseiaceae bacterium]|nr:LytTR family DNA-binding domain-containing protein [Woeseiaceae bacterium]